MDNEVAILLATYNGERYLEEQIESIIEQTYKNWVLYIRDDNSKDGTQKIIDKYIKKYPNKIIQIIDNITTNDACKNFMCLLEKVHKEKKYKMYMFCDQDDVWLKDKIEIMVNKYLEVENKEKPILIHTDSYVVDSNLNIICNSSIKYSGLNSKRKKFNSFLIQNNTRGCTILINNKLANLVKLDIENIIMHDWYFALIASAFGEIIYINKPTIKYRQHSNNVLGATTYRGIGNLFRRAIKFIKKIFSTNKKDIIFDEAYSQAESFRNYYYDMLDDNKKHIIDEFCSMNKCNKITKIYKVVKYKFFRHGLVRNIYEILYI